MAEPGLAVPALFSSTSRRPNHCTWAASRVSTPTGVLTSLATPRTWHPVAVVDLAGHAFDFGGAPGGDRDVVAVGVEGVGDGETVPRLAPVTRPVGVGVGGDLVNARRGPSCRGTRRGPGRELNGGDRAKRLGVAVLRLLRATDTDALAGRLRLLLDHDLAAAVKAEAVDLGPDLFGREAGNGVLMAVRAAGSAEDPATIAASLVVLASDLSSVSTYVRPQWISARRSGARTGDTP